MSGVAAAGLLVGAYSANQQANAARNAADTQTRYGNLSLAEMKRQFDIEQNNLAPWLRGGRKSLSELMTLMGLEGDTDAANKALLSSPTYRVAAEQGNRALSGSLAARGGMGSGKAMNAATTFGQNLALGTRESRLRELADMAGVGRATASNMGSSGRDYARSTSDILQNIGNVQGAAGVAGANARQSGLLGGAQLGLNLYDYMRRNNSGNWANNNNPNYSGPGFDYPY